MVLVEFRLCRMALLQHWLFHAGPLVASMSCPCFPVLYVLRWPSFFLSWILPPEGCEKASLRLWCSTSLHFCIVPCVGFYDVYSCHDCADRRSALMA